MIKLSEALRDERTFSPYPGVTVTVKPVGFARFNRLNAEVLIAARAALSADGDSEPDGMAIARYAEGILADRLGLESIVRWDGIGDETGADVAPTPESWALLRDLYPGLVIAIMAEIQTPGVLAATEGNA